MNAALLEEACDVVFGAGGPGERRAVVHQLSGHDERVPPLQLAVIPLTVMMDSKAVFKHNQQHQLCYYPNKRKHVSPGLPSALGPANTD